MSLFSRPKDVPEHKEFFHFSSASVFCPVPAPGESYQAYIDVPPPAMHGLPSTSPISKDVGASEEEDLSIDIFATIDDAFYKKFVKEPTYSQFYVQQIIEWLARLVLKEKERVISYRLWYGRPPPYTTEEQVWFYTLCEDVLRSWGFTTQLKSEAPSFQFTEGEYYLSVARNWNKFY